MKIKAFLIVVFVAGFIFNAQANVFKADFSGTWILDSSKSEGLPPNMQQTMTVVQNGDAISIETSFTTEMGNQSVKDNYNLNGKEEEFTAYWGNGAKGKRTSKWTADGNGFEVWEAVEFDSDAGRATGKMNRQWTMSADDKSLTIVLSFNAPQGEVVTKRVFNKK